MPYPTFVDLASDLRKTVSLDGQWGFDVDPQDRGKEQEWFAPGKALSGRIQVPGCWQAEGIGLAEDQHPAEGLLGQTSLRHQYLGTAWYKRKFVLPRIWPAQQVWLKLGGVCPASEVWVNGQQVGATWQPALPVRLNITDAVRADAENDVTVRVYEGNRGLGGWLNLNARWSGLYRPVEVEITRNTWVEDLWLIPDVGDSSVLARVAVASADASSRPVAVSVSVANAKGGKALATATERSDLRGHGTVDVRVPIAEPHLWSPSDPFLYRATVVLESGEEVLNSVADRFGLRRIETRGTEVYLNGHPIYLRGYGDDGYFPRTVCPETDGAVLRRQLETAKSYGFNYAYPCAYTPPEEFLDAADEVGMLLKVDAGSPLFFEREGRVPGQPAGEYTEGQKSLIDEEWQGLLRWTQNHPSVIIYSPGSELPGSNPQLAHMYQTAKAKDSTRLVMSWSVRAGSTDLADAGPAGTHPSGRVHLDLEALAAGTKLPLLLHEYIGAETLCSYDEEALYRDTPFVPEAAEHFRTVAARQGLRDEETRRLIANSRSVAAAAQKLCIEEARKASGIAGFSMWLFQDIPGLPQGVVDAFWRSKGASPDAFRRFNSDTVVLVDDADGQLRRCFWSGERVNMGILVSHFGPEPIRHAQLNWRIRAQADGKTLESGRAGEVDVACGDVKRVPEVAVRMPVVTTPTRGTLALRLAQGARTCSNEWEIRVLPKVSPTIAQGHVAVYDPGGTLGRIRDAFALPVAAQGAWAQVVIADRLDAAVLDHLQGGGRVLLLNSGQPEDEFLPSIPTCWMPHWEHTQLGREINATVIRPHPALGDFPDPGYCDLAFYNLISSVDANRGRAIRLDELGVPIDPIIRVFSERGSAAYLFEAQVGQGRLLATSLDFAGKVGVFPEASYLFGQLLRYCAGDAFQPRAALTMEALTAAAWGPVVDLGPGSSTRFPGTDLADGGLAVFPDARVLGRSCNWVYAACTQCSQMELSFGLRRLPAGPVELVIEGGSFADRHDLAHKVDVRIALNGHVLFEGPNQFPDDAFGELLFPIDAQHLRLGRNTIVISNLEPVGPLGDAPFLAVTALELRSP